MNEQAQQKIGQLIEPEPVTFSFAAPGWTFLLIIFILAITILVMQAYINYRRNRYRREAIAFINNLYANSVEDASWILYKTLETLKRVSFVSYGRKEQAHLFGNQWLVFLEEKNKGQQVFSDKVKVMISQAIYNGKSLNLSAQQLEMLREESINWIKSHHV